MAGNKDEKKIDPKTFCIKPEGEYVHPEKKRKLSISSKLQNPPTPVEKNITEEAPIPKPFDPKEYKTKENKKLEEEGSNLKVYNKNSYNLLLAVLIGVIIVFGLFFVWSVSNDKFKTDFDCPDCKCEQADLSCPTPAPIPDCICSQNFTCGMVNNSDIVDAIKSLNISSVIPANSSA